ncbi:OLC1v1000850C1 [Oldenlandia corymbosa var. corymbosa]|uniref:OLC1v1000850C1 n=1 Tax=Oldenlandia corymbosa var. corymbosa TaxID=529605 RepID=A0AAV1D5G8_OLDCO|nr:OLC1v1000850C1 [Oldenlandia corymbosa var. corymbosa]
MLHSLESSNVAIKIAFLENSNCRRLMEVLIISAKGKISRYIAWAKHFLQSNCSLQIRALGTAIPKAIVTGESLKCHLKGIQQSVDTSMTNGVSTIIINLSLDSAQDMGAQNRGGRKEANHRKKRRGKSSSHNGTATVPGGRMEWKPIVTPNSSEASIGNDISLLVLPGSMSIAYEEQPSLLGIYTELDYVIALKEILSSGPSLFSSLSPLSRMKDTRKLHGTPGRHVNSVIMSDVNKWWQGRKVFKSVGQVTFKKTGMSWLEKLGKLPTVNKDRLNISLPSKVHAVTCFNNKWKTEENGEEEDRCLWLDWTCRPRAHQGGIFR